MKFDFNQIKISNFQKMLALLALDAFSNQSIILSEICFHGPISKRKHPSIRKQWLANMKRGGELPKEEHFNISSHHFDEGCFKIDCKYSKYILFVFIQPDRAEVFS